MNLACPYANIPIHKSSRCALIELSHANESLNENPDDDSNVDIREDEMVPVRKHYVHRFESTSFTQSPRGGIWNEAMKRHCGNFAPFALRCSYTSPEFCVDDTTSHIVMYVPRNQTMFWRLPRDILAHWFTFVNETKTTISLYPTHKSLVDGIVTIVNESLHSFVMFRPISFSDTINDMAIGVSELIFNLVRNVTLHYTTNLFDDVPHTMLHRARPDNMYCDKIFAKRLSCAPQFLNENFTCVFKTMSTEPTRFWFVVAKCLFGQHNAYIHSVCCRRPAATYTHKWVQFVQALIQDRLIRVAETSSEDTDMACELRSTLKKSLEPSPRGATHRRTNVNTLTNLHKAWLQECQTIIEAMCGESTIRSSGGSKTNTGSAR